MEEKENFPSPEEVSFFLMDRKKGNAVPIDGLPEKEWKKLRGEILFHIGKGLSQLYLSRKAKEK